MKTVTFCKCVMPTLLGLFPKLAVASQLIFGFSSDIGLDDYVRASEDGKFSRGVGCVVPTPDDFALELYDNLKLSVVGRPRGQTLKPMVLVRLWDGRRYVLGQSNLILDTDGKVFVLDQTAWRFALMFARLELRKDVACAEIGMQ